MMGADNNRLNLLMSNSGLNTRNDVSFQSALPMPNTHRVGEGNESDYKVLHETSHDGRNSKGGDKKFQASPRSYYENQS